MASKKQKIVQGYADATKNYIFKDFFDSTSTLSKFMTANGIDTKELKSASDALGE